MAVRTKQSKAAGNARENERSIPRRRRRRRKTRATDARERTTIIIIIIIDGRDDDNRVLDAWTPAGRAVESDYQLRVMRSSDAPDIIGRTRRRRRPFAINSAALRHGNGNGGGDASITLLFATYAYARLYTHAHPFPRFSPRRRRRAHNARLIPRIVHGDDGDGQSDRGRMRDKCNRRSAPFDDNVFVGFARRFNSFVSRKNNNRAVPIEPGATTTNVSPNE